MAGGLKFRITGNPGGQWKNILAGLQDRLDKAIEASFNMMASFLKQTADADITSAGNFGERWTSGLHVNVEGSAPNMRLSMTHDIPYAKIFETGGTVTGNPMLWIPLSGTDAMGVRASAFPGGLFSPRKQRATGRPLLFSVTDKRPRYFGIDSINIQKKFHLQDDVNEALANYRQFFSDAWKAA